MHLTRMTSLMGNANGLDILDLDYIPSSDNCPPSLPDGYDPELYRDLYEDELEPVTVRNPPASHNTLPSFQHWPEEETCAPSSGGLCGVAC